MINSLQTEKLHQDESLSIEVDRKLNLLFTRWLRHPSSEEFRRSLTLASDYICDLECRYWLSDARKLYYMELADQNWLVSTMIPKINPYVARFARVMTEEGLSMLDMQRIKDKIEDEQKIVEANTRVEIFLDAESATEWLLQHHDSNSRV
ncbi:hypothetical protein [uncultured Pontibacter sp.]|uniref:hypothetical protein n=1 Tax=uncultured Pontibacter sp. TaxID=453356 RepID=UPI002610FF62|nr:hypothetical protein [uncultured Pontibacter sp.]